MNEVFFHEIPRSCEEVDVTSVQAEANDGFFSLTRSINPRQDCDVEISLDFLSQVDKILRKCERRHLSRVRETVFSFERYVIEQHLRGDMNLRFRSEDRDDIARRFFAWESNSRIRLGFNVVDEDALLSEESAMVPPGNRDRFNDEVFVLGTDQLHDALFQVLEVHGVLGRGTSDDIVFVVVVTSESGKLFSVRELDIDSVFLHDALNVFSSNSNDAFVIRLRYVERDLSGKFFL